MSLQCCEFQDHSSRLQQWLVMGFALLVLGIILHFTDGMILFPFVVEKEKKCKTYYPHSCPFGHPSHKTTICD